jgi:hypothetical protein
MNSFLGFVVGILQTTLAMLGLVQQHPELPQPVQDQVTQAAQQVVTQTSDAVSKQASAKNANLKTYTNSQYGFSVQYPATVTFNPDCAEGEPVCRGNPLVVFYENDAQSGSKFSDGYVVVNASKTPSVVNSCLTAGADFGSSVKTINGVQFTVFNGPPDAGMGRYTDYHAYNTLRDGTCYSIAVDKRYFSVAQPKTSQAEKDLDGILQSFTFTQSSSAISVTGMSKYTDSDFGFSFWYPSGWTLDSDRVGAGDLEDCTLKKSYSVHGDQYSNGVSIKEYYCPNLSITLRGVGASPVGMDFRYYFNKSTHMWMEQDLSDPPNGSPRSNGPADISNNTMGGLHIFPGAERFGADVVIPLSARNFLIIATNSAGGYIDERLFANTIVATDPSVATPVSTSQQIATIQSEKDAYVPDGSHSYTNSTYGFTMKYPANFSVDDSIHQTYQGVQAVSIGKPSQSTTVTVIPGPCPPVYVGPDNEQVPANSLVLNGTTFSSYSWSDPAAGQLGITKAYQTVHAGNCYAVRAFYQGVEPGHYQGAEAAKVQADDDAGIDAVDAIARSFSFTSR